MPVSAKFTFYSAAKLENVQPHAGWDFQKNRKQIKCQQETG
jgi:hypothetical protein